MQVSVKLDLPLDVFNIYESQGPLDKVLAAQLAKCCTYAAKKPLYINDEQRQALDKLFGRNFGSADELVKAVAELVSISVDNVEVPLNPLLTKRLKSRCFGKPFNQFLAERAIAGLEEFAGMR